MRYYAGIALVILAGLSAHGTGKDLMSQGHDSEANRSRVPVVVELFTSEGCSSCPPADALLEELENRQPFGNVEIIAVEEHVDYWDQQGWVDPFSSSSWTSRQYAYTNVLGSGNPYTPEMVVDGRDGFVGSHSGKARQAIEAAATMKKTQVNVSEISPLQNKSVTLNVDVEKLPTATGDTAEVLLAITEAGLHSKVEAGENSGRELHHAPVLRELKEIGALDRNGSEPFSTRRVIKLNGDWKAENLRAVVFVQEKKSKHILGAAEIRIAPEDPKPR